MVSITITAVVMLNFGLSCTKPSACIGSDARCRHLFFIANPILIVSHLIVSILDIHKLKKLSNFEYYGYNRNTPLEGLLGYKDCSTQGFAEAIEKTAVPAK